MSFISLNLNKSLLRALDEMGLEEPTVIQRNAIPVVKSGKDVIAVAPTGTGKTIAYLLPILNELKFSKQKEPRVLIIVPTRELAVQVFRVMEKLLQFSGLRPGVVYGGTNINTQKQVVVDGLDILVGTPGRVIDLAYNGALKAKAIKKLVIDEMDELLQLGFRTQLIDLLDILPQKRQNLLFSATSSDEVNEMSKEYFNVPTVIELSAEKAVWTNIEQKAFSVPNFTTKVNLLEHLLINDPEFEKVLVFVSNKKLADLLHAELELIFPDQTSVIHSNKSQNYRLGAINKFDLGVHPLLIASDLIARGLDFKSVTHVINFDFPETKEDYIHRIGRTGRAGAKGIAISFVTEKDLDNVVDVEIAINQEFRVIELPNEIVVSDVELDFEVEKKIGKNYLPEDNVLSSGGAYHEKSAKNSKVNLGGSYRRDLAAKYKKPIRKGDKIQNLRKKK